MTFVLKIPGSRFRTNNSISTFNTSRDRLLISYFSRLSIEVSGILSRRTAVMWSAAGSRQLGPYLHAMIVMLIIIMTMIIVAIMITPQLIMIIIILTMTKHVILVMIMLNHTNHNHDNHDDNTNEPGLGGWDPTCMQVGADADAAMNLQTRGAPRIFYVC